jgi:hypothetical protein
VEGYDTSGARYVRKLASHLQQRELEPSFHIDGNWSRYPAREPPRGDRVGPHNLRGRERESTRVTVKQGGAKERESVAVKQRELGRVAVKPRD